MPYVNGVMTSPDDAIAAGYCPECGSSFKAESALAHLNQHWHKLGPLTRENLEAHRRRGMIEDYVKANNIKAAPLEEETLLLEQLKQRATARATPAPAPAKTE